MAVILVTHDLGVIAGHSDRVASCTPARSWRPAPPRTCFDNPRHPYTEALFPCVAENVDPDRALYAIPGLPPTCRIPQRLPVAERCGYATDRMPRGGAVAHRGRPPVRLFPSARSGGTGHSHPRTEPAPARTARRCWTCAPGPGLPGELRTGCCGAPDGTRQRGGRRVVHRPGRGDVRAGRRVGLRQEHGRQAARCRGHPHLGLGQLRRHRDQHQVEPGAARTAAGLPADVPGSVRLTGPTDAGALDSCASRWPSSAEGPPRSRNAPSPRCSTRSACLGPRWRSIARVLRRAAAADRPGQGARAATEADRGRRAGVRAGRLGAGADPQPDARPAARARPDLRVSSPTTCP